MPVDPPPGILGTVEGLGVRGNRNDAEARLIAVCRELTGDDLFTVALADRLRSEVTPNDREVTTGDSLGDPGAVLPKL
jgi:hypothetical protein